MSLVQAHIATAALLILLFWGVACGGGVTPAPEGATPKPTVEQTPDDRCLDEPETVNGYQDGDGCPDTSPTMMAEPVVFTGIVVNGPARQDGRDGASWWELDVEVERVLKTDEGQVWIYEYVPGEVITVVYLEEPPDIAEGDLVEIGGRISRFACGAACDAAGLIGVSW